MCVCIFKFEIKTEFLFNWFFIIYQHDWSWNVGMFKTVSKQEISPQRCKNKPMRKEGLYFDVSSFVIANSLITLIVLDLLENEIYEWKKNHSWNKFFFVPKGNIVIGQVVFVPMYLYDVMSAIVSSNTSLKNWIHSLHQVLQSILVRSFEKNGTRE